MLLGVSPSGQWLVILLAEWDWSVAKLVVSLDSDSSGDQANNIPDGLLATAIGGKSGSSKNLGPFVNFASLQPIRGDPMGSVCINCHYLAHRVHLSVVLRIAMLHPLRSQQAGFRSSSPR